MVIVHANVDFHLRQRYVSLCISEMQAQIAKMGREPWQRNVWSVTRCDSPHPQRCLIARRRDKQHCIGRPSRFRGGNVTTPFPSKSTSSSSAYPLLGRRGSCSYEFTHESACGIRRPVGHRLTPVQELPAASSQTTEFHRACVVASSNWSMQGKPSNLCKPPDCAIANGRC